MIGKMVASAAIAVNLFAVAGCSDDYLARDQCLLGVAQWTFNTDLIDQVDRTEDGVAVIIVNQELFDQLEPAARAYVEYCISIIDNAPPPEDWPLMPPEEEI